MRQGILLLDPMLRRPRDRSRPLARMRSQQGLVPANNSPGISYRRLASARLRQHIWRYFPTPTNNAAQNNYTLSKPVPDTLTSNSNVFMTRIDHNYGDKDHFYFFWWRQFTGYNTATQLPTPIATESPTRPQNSPIARFNWEHTFSTTLTNHATFGYLNRNEDMARRIWPSWVNFRR